MLKSLSLKSLLRIDCIAALTAGLLLLVFQNKLSVFFGLPENLLVAQAIISFIYSNFSFYLLRQPSSVKRLVTVLVVANLLYASTSLLLCYYFCSTASLFGIIYLASECILISTLALLEWKRIK